MTQNEKLVLVGLIALVNGSAAIAECEALDRTETAIQKFLEGQGVSEDDARIWAGELVYNEGDDPIAAVDRALGILELEVEE